MPQARRVDGGYRVTGRKIFASLSGAAKIAQGALVISFASENVDELKRMKDVVRQEPGTVMTGNLAMPIYLSDDDSDSDSDDDIPIENFVKVGPQNKTLPPTEG